MKKPNLNVDVYISIYIFPATTDGMRLSLCQNRDKIVIDLLYCEPKHGDFQVFRESVKGGGGLTNESGASEYIFLSSSVFREALLSGSEFNTAIKRFDGPTAFKNSLLCDMLS